MSKMNRHDLQTKSRAQLAALFHEASLRIRALPASSRALEDQQLALAMILLELARRGPSP